MLQVLILTAAAAIPSATAAEVAYSESGRPAAAAVTPPGVPALSFHEFTAGFQGLMQRSVPANGVLPHGAESMPGEPAQILAAANFLRDNIVWSEVETAKGQYNFSRTDALLAEYDAAGGRSLMRWMATLAYSNPLYDSPGPPTSKEGVDAFVAFVVAAVRRYGGRGVLWELWCEPNGAFWDGGKGNVTQYIALAAAVHEGVVAAGLQTEAFIGPNTAMWWQYDVDLPFLEACLRGGVLKYWSAINLHLYRASPPETVQDSYRKTRALIRRYLPEGMSMPPLISGEWGYSDQVWGQTTSGWYPYTGQIDTMTQAKYLARMWLTNALEGVPSIWCKFLSGTGQVTSSGDMLGVVHAPYETPAQPHAPKPAYVAATTLHTYLRGGIYRGRISANFAKPLADSSIRVDVQPVDWRGRPLPTRSAGLEGGLGGHPAVAQQQQMTDPDGISVMCVSVALQLFVRSDCVSRLRL